jgi:hypothetical protein
LEKENSEGNNILYIAEGVKHMQSKYHAAGKSFCMRYIPVYEVDQVTKSDQLIDIKTLASMHGFTGEELCYADGHFEEVNG